MRTAEETAKTAKLQNGKELKGNRMSPPGPPSKQEKSRDDFEMNMRKIKIWGK